MRMNLEAISYCLGCSDKCKLTDKTRGLSPKAVRMDSRLIKEQDLFVCIAGNRTDGHNYAAEVAEKGALAIIAERDPFNGQTPPIPVFLVENTIKSLGRLATCHRDMTEARVVGITGTAGKTSVKEVLGAVLAVHGPTSRNPSNMNNQIGLPLSMLNASTDDMFWVMEAGISAAHDMDELGTILSPDLAIILNVGPGHLTGLGDKGVAYYKARFLAHLTQSGVALVSADYPDLVTESLKHGRSVVHFSTKRTNVDYTASYLGPASAATGRYRVTIQGKSYEMVAPFRGNFGSENVAAIVGAAHLLGLKTEEIALGLSGAALPAQRFCCSNVSKWTIIDDSYNANPLSTSRMLDAAKEMAGESNRPLLLVMGEMLELGSETEKAHREIGKIMADASMIIWKGGQAEAVTKGLADANYKGKFITIKDADDFRDALKEKPAEGGVVLFKGSRGNHLEEMASIFTQEILN